MGLGGSLAAVLAAVSASSLPGIPLCPGTHRRVVGPGQALRWRVTVGGSSVALSSDRLLMQIVNELRYNEQILIAQEGYLAFSH